MLHKDKRRLYRKTTLLLGGFTPLRLDCGVLCSKRCCKGDAETGMLLFPGEASALCVKERSGRRIAVCDGSCSRADRPLACKIFPFLPVRDSRRRVRVIPDVRGYGICPLVRQSENVTFSQRFLHRLRRAGVLLYADADCRAFLQHCAEEGDRQAALRASFFEKIE